MRIKLLFFFFYLEVWYTCFLVCNILPNIFLNQTQMEDQKSKLPSFSGWVRPVEYDFDRKKNRLGSAELEESHFYQTYLQPRTSQVVLVVKNLSANAGDITDTGSTPALGRSPRGGQGNPFQYSCLKYLMDRGTWQAEVHRVAKSQTRLKWLTTTTATIPNPTWN